MLLSFAFTVMANFVRKEKILETTLNGEKYKEGKKTGLSQSIL
jgi:hypothetical protein